ncbi:protein-disulfide reductase DsbD [Leucothrix pacifica]|uniref:Thiol:disulfide interchange protein DsbD n=1 Tax=Leucothrix pacifica TaxID=1247513 RepID=A0A317C7U3_9GAMM|nr:protein-disulfide reductase DsbD [Leucothrix pacifica]PWQ94399.1 thiol:disulfide interchange protein [Leucothrix pacifica]
MRNKSTDKCVENPKHLQFIQDFASVFRWSQVLLLLVLLTVGVSHAQSSPDNPSLNTLQSVLGETQPNISSSSLIANDTAGSMGLLQSAGFLGFGGGSDDQGILPPDKAYSGSVSLIGGELIEVFFAIRDCCYLYKDKFTFATDSVGLTLGQPNFPEGSDYSDAFYGDMKIYRKQVRITIPVFIEKGQTSPLMLRVGYQGCADVGVCYPPQNKVFSVDISPSGISDESAANNQADGKNSPLGYVSEQDRLANFLAANGVWSLPLFFVLGVLLAFTPCVLPMIPILSGIITADKAITQGKAFSLSLAYVLAMALTYSLIGVLAVASGANLQAVFQHPAVLITFSALFVFLSLPMFGVFELQLPVAWQNWLTNISQRQRGGQFIGVSVMGGLSALIVGPCVAAPLIGILTYITLTGDMVFGGLTLFVLGLGMGLPLLVIGTTAGRWVPRAGPWMQVVKAGFGVGLLAVAIWLLSRILPTTVNMLLWALLLLGVAFALMYFGRATNRSVMLISSATSLISMSLGIALIWSTASGVNDINQLLSSLPFRAAPQNSPGFVEKPAFTRIKSSEELDAKLKAAGRLKKPVILDFYADWCVSCIEMEQSTFHDPGVAKLMSRFTLLQADVTKNDVTDQALLKRFGIFGPPAILFFPPQENEMRQYRAVGFMNANDFSALLTTVLNTKSISNL